MKTTLNTKRITFCGLGVVALLAIAVILPSVPVFAQGPEHRPHGEFVDSRHDHNRSYPARDQYVRRLPDEYRIVNHRSSRYYFAGGAWYRPMRGRFIVVAPPIGMFVPFLPLAYVTLWVHGIPYYYANEVYYTPTAGGYVVAEPPNEDISTTPPAAESTVGNQLFIYPRQGQSEKQQANDRYDCHTWAVGQTTYDPIKPPSGMSAGQLQQKRADYQRAMGACLEGRGYTVK